MRFEGGAMMALRYAIFLFTLFAITDVCFVTQASSTPLLATSPPGHVAHSAILRPTDVGARRSIRHYRYDHRPGRRHRSALPYDGYRPYHYNYELYRRCHSGFYFGYRPFCAI